MTRGVTIVAAVAANRVIGSGGGLPWSIPRDMHRFKSLTLGGAVIMGRSTYDSIGRALPGRVNVVLTRNADFDAPGTISAFTPQMALDVARQAVAGDGENVFVIGGGVVYRQFLNHADRLELTLVHSEPEGDTLFPTLRKGRWSCLDHEHHEGNPSYAFHSLAETAAVGERRVSTTCFPQLVPEPAPTG